MFDNCQFSVEHNLSRTSQLFRSSNNKGSIWIVEQPPVEHPNSSLSKSLSQRSRNLDFVSFQSQKSQVLRSGNLSRPEIFGKSWQFVLVSIESELILAFISNKISQFVKIFEPEVLQKVSNMSRYLDKSPQISISLDNLDLSQKSWFVLTMSRVSTKSWPGQVTIQKSRF